MLAPTSMVLSRAVAAGILTTIVSCSTPRTDCFIGDPGAAPELSLVTRSAAGVAPLVDGGPIDLVQPPQGGKVVFASVKARNVPCLVQLTGSLRDEASGRLVAVEGRPVVLVPGADGWGAPEAPAELQNYANIPVCPSGNIALQKDMFNQTFTLRVRIEFGDAGVVSSAELPVVPRCVEAAIRGLCECECSGAYKLGDPCPLPDGGGP